MPQPFSEFGKRFKGGKRFTVLMHKLGPDALASRPELAVLAAQVIGQYALLQFETGKLLIRMLGAHAAPAMAMYIALTSSAAAQRNALAAAASHMLDDADTALFSAVMKNANSVAKRRHDIAHHLWGETEILPDALLLADPIDVLEMERISHETRRRGGVLRATNTYTAREINRLLKFVKGDGIMVYRKKDFEDLLRDIIRAVDLVRAMSDVADEGHPERDLARQRLLNEPEIQRELSRLREGTKNEPKPVHSRIEQHIEESRHGYGHHILRGGRVDSLRALEEAVVAVCFVGHNYLSVDHAG